MNFKLKEGKALDYFQTWSDRWNCRAKFVRGLRLAQEDGV
jgi:hypothetical protein